MTEFYGALGEVAPFVAVVLIFGFFLAQIFGFKPIGIMQRHGVIVAVVLILAFAIVAIVALVVRQPDPSFSSLGSGAQLKQFFELNAATPDRNVSIIPGNEEVVIFTTTAKHTAHDDRALALAICNFYGVVRCDEPDSRTIRMVYDDCPEGLPGDTAWIFAGEFDRSISPPVVKQGPFVSARNGSSAVSIQRGMEIVTIEDRRTYINNYSSSGTLNKLESPFENLGRDVEMTCRTVPSGTTLYVADVKLNGPNTSEQHLWFRVRTEPIGG